jgi:hypothetical protein
VRLNQIEVFEVGNEISDRVQAMIMDFVLAPAGCNVEVSAGLAKNMEAGKDSPTVKAVSFTADKGKTHLFSLDECIIYVKGFLEFMMQERDKEKLSDEAKEVLAAILRLVETGIFNAQKLTETEIPLQ